MELENQGARAPVGSPDILSKKEAGAIGLDRYFTGKPCKRGHISHRHLSNGACIACMGVINRAWYNKHRERANAKNKAWYANNTERAKALGKAWRQGRAKGHKRVKLTAEEKRDRIFAARLMREYGIEKAYYDLLLEKQNNSCAICSAAFGNKRRHVDHDHGTGVVRGVLCNSCNPGLGYFKDNPAFLSAAAKYLTEALKNGT